MTAAEKKIEMMDVQANRQRPDRQRNGLALVQGLLLGSILLLALFMRVYDLGHTPLGVHYDEAANVILADEIAHGARPIFIRAYTGKEVGYFYLAALAIRLIGHPLIAVRLASAWIGVLSVALTYRTARELFAAEGEGRGAWIALAAAAIQALNLWAITVSRLGFRALLQPALQVLVVLFIYRGLRHTGRRAWLDWALAGIWCGLSAYTYLAIRAFPILLAGFLLWIVALIPVRRAQHAARPALQGRLLRLGQVGLFVAAAAVVFAPLGRFYVLHPEFFATRMGQVSVFSPEVGGSNPWPAFWYAVKVSFGMFTFRGDLNWRFNVAGAPALWWPLGVFFYLGLLIGAWRLIRPGDALRRGTYFLLLLWLPVMLLPSVLGGENVEVSLSLRAIGVMPALFYWPALGLVESGLALQRLALKRRVWRMAGGPFVLGLAGVLLGASGAHAFAQCFQVWGPSAPGYYVASGYLVEAANLLNARLPPDADCYISAEHYRHPTVALLARRYADLKWLVGPDVLVFPTNSERETWYVLTHEAMPSPAFLDRFFGPPDEEHLGPDGQPAFRVYRFPPGEVPVPHPQVPGEANLGNTLRFLGYDLNTQPVSGDALDVTLYFQALRDGDRDDYAFFAHLVDDLGFQWGGKTFFTYPSIQWRAGEVMAFRSTFPIWAGAPPGAYTLDVGAFSSSLDARLPLLNQAGQMAGTAIHVGPLEVARAAAPPSALPPIQQPLEVLYDVGPGGLPGLALHGFDRDRGDVRPGETLALSLYWQSSSKVEGDYFVSMWLEGRGERISLWQGPPVRGQYPFRQWQPAEFVRDRYALRLPTGVPAGDWELRLALLRPDGSPQPTSQGEEALSLCTIHVQASDRLWTAPAFAYPVGARLGDVAELLGYDLDRHEVQPGQEVHLTVVWRSLGETETAYTVFIHLLDEGGQVRGQKDNPPVNGSYPTPLWVPGEIVVDEYTILVQPDAPPGTYVIEAGMYDPANLQRLPVLDPTGASGDRVLLGSVQVER